MREIINRIRYVLRDGIAGEALPKDRPPWYLGDASFRKLGGTGRLDQIQHELLRKERAQSGRAPSPTVAILDSQTVKGEAPQGERGSDEAKKRVGRKRHVAVDPGGRLLASVVTTADGPDQEAGLGLAAWLVRLCPWIERVIGDGGTRSDSATAFVVASVALSKWSSGHQTPKALWSGPSEGKWNRPSGSGERTEGCRRISNLYGFPISDDEFPGDADPRQHCPLDHQFGGLREVF